MESEFEQQDLSITIIEHNLDPIEDDMDKTSSPRDEPEKDQAFIIK